MFNISNEYNLDICQPSFDDTGQISHIITKHLPNVLLTYVNFIENGVALFNKKSLINFMNYYSEELIGWGIDYLYIWCNGTDKKQNYAIIHKIKCLNPNKEQKGVAVRELSLIKNCDKRQQIWEKFAERIGCPKYIKVETYQVIN